MADVNCTILDGPDKPALLWSVAYPDRPETVIFNTDDGAIEAVISEMNELSDGISFSLRGRIISGPSIGQPFVASYSVETRSGEIVMDSLRS